VSVLVDTSVWIRFLSNRAPYANELDALLGRDDVSGHEFVYGELLLGDAKSGRKALLSRYEMIEWAPTVSHLEVAAFVRARRLHGRGIGWIDAHLVASALVGGFALWTADAAVTGIARELGTQIAGTSELVRSGGGDVETALFGEAPTNFFSRPE
jgi:predicted nucleic acid-binding protein